MMSEHALQEFCRRELEACYRLLEEYHPMCRDCELPVTKFRKPCLKLSSTVTKQRQTNMSETSAFQIKLF